VMPEAFASASRVASAALNPLRRSIKRLSSRRKNSSSRLRPRSRRISGVFGVMASPSQLHVSPGGQTVDREGRSWNNPTLIVGSNSCGG